MRRKEAWTTTGDAPGGNFTVIRPELREDWIGADGARHWRTRPTAELRFPTREDRTRFEALGSPEVSSPWEHRHGPPRRPPFSLGNAPLTYQQLLDLPRDPEALYRRMHQASVDCECGNGVDEETFVIAADLIRDNPIPADLRAATLRAAALIPGIELLDDQRDVAGRPGVGVAFDGEGGSTCSSSTRRPTSCSARTTGPAAAPTSSPPSWTQRTRCPRAGG